MKKGNNNKKEIIKVKLKKRKSSTVNKRIGQREPDPWKEIQLKLQPLSKAYRNFRQKRKIAKEKEKLRRLKREEEQRLKEEKRRIDEQKKKRLNGKVKWFSGAKGYGFIERENEEKDIFVHFSAVKNSGLKYLKEGEQLTFEVENTDKGPSAINLQKTVNEVFRPHLKVVK